MEYKIKRSFCCKFPIGTDVLGIEHCSKCRKVNPEIYIENTTIQEKERKDING